MMKNIEYISELSPAQQGMLFHTIYAPEAGMYFNQSCWRLRGQLERDCFRAAWQQLVDRHAVLRTAFFWEDLDKPVQVAYHSVELPWRELDWRGITPAEEAARFAELLQRDRQEGVQLEKAPLMRVTLIQVGEEHYRFLWSCHHLITDGWSTATLFKEFLLLYNALRQGQTLVLEPPHSYREYIAWLQQQDLGAAETYWRAQLADFTTPTTFPMARQGQASAANGEQAPEQYAAAYELLDADTTAQLQRLARTQRLTMNVLMQGAWALLLSRYSGETDVLFGATVSGRPATLRGVESMVGLFINTLPARIQTPPAAPLTEWLQSMMADQAQREHYLYTPLVEIQGWSDLPSDTPLFESILVVENYPVDATLNTVQTAGVTVEEFRAIEQDQYPITMVVMPGQELHLQVLYSADRFDAATITRLLGHFKTILTRMAAKPTQRLGELPLLTAAERHQLLVTWNDTAVVYPTDRCIHHLFEEQAAQAPAATAVVGGEGCHSPLATRHSPPTTHLTFRELNERANQVAHRLRALGVGTALGREPFVGLCLTRSAELVVGLLGILKAGGAYIPLDPTYPKARLAFMLEDAQAPILLTERRLVADLPAYAGQVICLDDDPVMQQQSTQNLAHAMDPTQLAYMIYTSGSTGKPKGVMIEHRNAVNYLRWARQAYAVAAGNGAPVNSSISFDATITSLVLPLVAGRPVQLLPEAGEIEVLSTQLQTQQDFSLVKITPAHLYMLNHLLPPQSAAGQVRALVIGGEQLLYRQVAFWRAHAPETRLINEYGPTETVVGCCVYEIPAADLQDDDGAAVPIGRPIANTQLYVLDGQGQPTPIGVPGELYIGGAGVGRGYWQRPDLTTAKFVPDPFSNDPQARLYRTGDLVRYRADGNLEFLGRIDQQVKLRGYRIELGEIDTQLAAHPAVQEAVTLLAGDAREQQQLITFFVSAQRPGANGKQPTTADLTAYLAETLPAYMVPAEFVAVDAIPLTPNGKVDRARLLEELTGQHTDTQPPMEPALPRTATEQALTEIWRDVLGRPDISIHDNFFANGGNSLLATKVISRAYRRFRVRLPLQLIFEQSTIAAMAANIEQTNAAVQTLQAQPAVALRENEEEGEI
ncbi:MAG: amino acid adenylation domain-containing protein [Caldilineaceae bacterium]